MTAIDVSTPEARQAILDDWGGAKLPRPVVNAAFARIDALEDLARDLAKELMEHRGPVDATLDRARSAGVHP